MRQLLAVGLLCGLLSAIGYSAVFPSSAAARTLLAPDSQFVGPEVEGRVSTVQDANSARIGSYITVEGQIVDHLREDYYTFRDETGEIRIEVTDRVWGNRTVTPETQVRLLAEIDRNLTGRYLWVKSLEIVGTSPTAETPDAAGFVGPETTGQVSTVQEANSARIGSYITVEGQIVDHLRDDYYTFRDETGEIRIEVTDRVWGNRTVTPDTQVRLLAEIDRTLAGVRYLWVKTLEVVE